jgi:hypothetical protein
MGILNDENTDLGRLARKKARLYPMLKKFSSGSSVVALEVFASRAYINAAQGVSVVNRWDEKAGLRTGCCRLPR